MRTYMWGDVYLVSPVRSLCYYYLLYRAQGKLVGVIPELKMDYKLGKAWVNFRVVEGPQLENIP